MIYAFDVIIYCKDGSRNNYTVVAHDDVEARQDAVGIMIHEYKSCKVKTPGVEYCEIKLICEIHPKPRK